MKSKANDDYKIIKKLGERGFEEIYLVEKGKKFYALKKSKSKLSEKEIEAYNQIIDILNKIDNEHVIKYHRKFKEKDTFNILMEYAGDQNLKQFIKNFKDKNILIEEKIIKDIIIQICEGLKEIHKNKLIHGDLTPDNIFINKNNKIKIWDLGISTILNTNNFKQSGKRNYHYFAPEIEIGGKFNHKIDIYSLGCIIYELFTLNEYYIDKKVLEKDCKINLDIYNPIWQELIYLLLKKDYHERPEVEEILNKIKMMKSDMENEIKLLVKVRYWEIGERIYFLNNVECGVCWFPADKQFHNLLSEMNEKNTELFIEGKKYKFNKFFIPQKEGTYSIKIKFNFFIKDCSYMFYNCYNLINVDLSSFNTKNVSNMEGMFSCNELKSIDLSLINTENVTNMSSLFNFCVNLENCNLSNLNTKKVINMKNMFHKCNKLQKIDLSSFETKNVTNMEGMFGSCFSLNDIDLSLFNTKKVNNMSFMFGYCEGLKSLNLSSFDTKNVTNMNGMFENCSNLKILDLSSFDTKNVTDMSYMFHRCTNLNSLNLSSFNTKNVTNMNNMFSLNGLTSINLSSFDTRNVTDMGLMFNYSCFKSLDLTSFDTRKATNMDCIFENCQFLKLIKVNKKTFKLKNKVGGIKVIYE